MVSVRSMVGRAVLGLSGAVLIAQPAFAQDYMDQVIDQNFQSMSLYAGSVPIEYEAKRAFKSRVSSARPAPRGLAAAFSGGGGGAAASAAPIPLTYSSTPAIRKQAMAEFLGRVRQKNPAHASAAAAQFAKHDYAKIWQGIVAPFGLKSNDAGDAMTAYLVLGWMIVNGAGDPSPADVRGVRSQIGTALSRDSRFNSPSGRAKLGEEFKILFVTLHSGWQSARKEGNLSQYGRGVSQMMLQQSGIDLSSVALRGGFVPKRG
ncbi:DUF6683 family protein [Sphingomonas crocodyli]|uniref:Uncharacterized protein n=1 Tax=Sphingomonas crocodyli TaxID=1979270 RepID=A0A437M713_9SPHN|nr:DUF6683 family protein [Sphingomonas crocodyli]RVT93294.1 hypothetical protein EOD43_05255 [Sphingomonas crocodyli]